MRLPFDLSESKFEQDARVKFSFTSPELHQNIEISLDGEDTSVEALLDAFQRFLGALGICTPDDVILAFVKMDPEDLEEDNNEEEDN
jgi:hypothetical protein